MYKRQIKYWASELADESKEYLKNSDQQMLKENLTLSGKIPNLNYVHIYKINSENNKPELFYSYKRSERRSAIHDKSNKIAELSKPKVIENSIEYIYPIKLDDKVIGFIYLHSSKEHIELITDDLLTTNALIMFFAFLAVIIVALQLERYIKKPFYTLMTTIQIAAKQKNFKQKCKSLPYQEADMLSRNINTLFTRMDKYISQLHTNEQENIEHAQQLEDKINMRTAALKESNQELVSTLEKLHQFQGQLVESEKMASLGDMVAGVAHEVNTPIGLGVTASTLLADRNEEMKIAFDNKTLKSSQLKKFLYESGENIDIIYRNLNRAADLISSFKKVAVDQSSEDIRSFDIKQLLDDVLLTLRPELQDLPYIIDIHCPQDLTIRSKPGPINQILINLIMNSVIHGFDGRDNGTISITIMPLSNQLNILFQDDGRGVDESIKNKVFEPFTTTKRGEGGSGLGLHLVYNLVTQALGGTIVLTSEIDKGVTIEINFPIN